ncbi:MAG: bifunctional isocitrate dehydrogenase kinase/phosphatase [Microscillaceae bacterium]
MKPTLPPLIAERIRMTFEAYRQEFDAITQKAQNRFEKEEWHQIQQDSQERLNLYKSILPHLAQALRQEFGVSIEELAFWPQVKPLYAQAIAHRPDVEIAETFYNSLFTRLFQHRDIEDTYLFKYETQHQRPAQAPAFIYQRYRLLKISATLKAILADFAFDVPYAQPDLDVAHIAARLQAEILPSPMPEEAAIEMHRTVFFRNKGAYLVGRLCLAQQHTPFVLALLNRGGKIFCDALILDENTVSILFSFTRSYFLVQTPAPSATVAFLKSLLPRKEYAELYNSIGFSKHGKTEFIRSFTAHLQNTEDQFVIAPGIRGMVMAVFTLPSYNVVFKLIKDYFDPPKQTTRGQVKEKYKLVSRHDRVGRMADTHEFENLEFDRRRFAPELLDELKTVAPSLIEERGDVLLIRHLYIERRMTPLNLYLQEASLEQARYIIQEYGDSIKELAAANIFPGDMLLKNFGVTRHRRVIFYDYDEICFLTDCNFRHIPEARNEQDEYADEPWYSVGPNDIFPEEFRRFLIGRRDVRQLFFDIHQELFEPAFWQGLQSRIRNGEILDVYPYQPRHRLGPPLS